MKNEQYAWTINRVLLGLTMLVAGLLKIFVMGPDAVTGMLSGLGFPAAMFFAWVLILSEIIFGIAVLASWKLKYTVWPPIVILLVAAFTVHWGSWSNFLLHLAAASNFWLLSLMPKHK